MSNKNPFELRFDMLQMAKDLAMEEWYSRQNFDREVWEQKVTDARENNQPAPERPNNPAFPSIADIMQKAEQLKAFVDNVTAPTQNQNN